MIVPTIICRARSTLRALFRMAVPPVLSSTFKAELEKVKAQKQSSAAPAAEPASPTESDPKCQPGVQDWRHLQRELRDLRQLRQVAKEAMFLCNGMKERQSRMGTELALQQQEIVVLQKQLMKEEQAGAVHSLSEPLKENTRVARHGGHGLRPGSAVAHSGHAHGVPVHDQGLWCICSTHPGLQL
jgi:hypothetical protein